MMNANGQQPATGGLTRRSALSLMSASAAAAAAGWSGLAGAGEKQTMPWLATEEQREAERILLALMEDPAIKALQAKIRAGLAVGERAKIPDAAATLDESIDQWTRSLIFAELTHRPADPVFFWATDDTPREWLGHTLGGVGTSGDNPDAIYRTAGIEGGGRYEIIGRYHPSGRPVQFLMEVDKGDMAQPASLMPVSDGKHEDIHNAAMIDDSQLIVAEDGSFRITLAGPGDTEWAKGPNHLTIPPEGYCMVGVRDILSDWREKPPQLSIRRLDAADPQPWTLETVRAKALADLEGYIGFWSHFPDIWFGGLKANERSEPQGRPGGWGFVAGINFSLAPDEAMVVTTTRGPARYTGFQINNPWMIAPDARLNQVCLNISQVVPDKNGKTVTYVIAMADPGVANWLDTVGMRDGVGILRWQAVPPDMTNEGLIRDLRVVKLAEIADMADLARVTPKERKAQVAARWAAYSSRVR